MLTPVTYKFNLSKMRLRHNCRTIKRPSDLPLPNEGWLMQNLIDLQLDSVYNGMKETLDKDLERAPRDA